MLKGIVEIEKLRLRAFHGVMPQERRVGNLFEVSVALEYDMEEAAMTDDVASALDYSKVAAAIADEMSRPSALLENVVWRLKCRICADFPMVRAGRICLAKVTPPIPGRMDYVSVTTRW